MENTVSPDLKRLFKAALAFRVETQAEWARERDVTGQHLSNMLLGHHPSRRLVAEIKLYVHAAVQDQHTLWSELRKAA